MNYQFDKRNPKVDEIIDLVCEACYVTREEMLSKNRKREYAIPRFMAMTILKDFTDVSLKTIGQHLGGRDHTTVIHGVETLQDLIFQDRVLGVKFQSLKDAIVLNLHNKGEQAFADEEFYSEIIYASNWEGWKESKPLEEVEE